MHEPSFPTPPRLIGVSTEHLERDGDERGHDGLLRSGKGHHDDGEQAGSRDGFMSHDSVGGGTGVLVSSSSVEVPRPREHVYRCLVSCDPAQRPTKLRYFATETVEQETSNKSRRRRRRRRRPLLPQKAHVRSSDIVAGVPPQPLPCPTLAHL